MKITFLLFVLFFLNGCAFYSSRICDSTSNKARLIQEIVIDPSCIESIIKNSRFFHSEISKYIFLNQSSKGDFIKYLNSFIGKKLIQNTNIKTSVGRYRVEYDYSTRYTVLEHHLGFLFEGSDKGILVVFEFHDNNWYLIGISKTNSYDLKINYEHG